MDAQVITNDSIIANSWRPYGFDEKGRPVDEVGHILASERELRTNSFLTREEWERLDKAVFAMGKQRLNAYADVVSAGLVNNTSLAEEYTKWRVASERIAADVTMDFRTRRTQDRTDKKTYGQPLPIVSAEFTIGARELQVQRSFGTPIETFEAEEAAAAVSEKLEDILVHGHTGIVVNGTPIYGYTTLGARDTNSAAGYGGGDFGTISNIRPTFLGMLTALAAKRYYGPFACYIANTQYWQMQARYTDGSDLTALQSVQSIPEISFVKPNDLLADGVLLMVQLTRNVVDLQVAMTMQTRKWESPDGSASFYLVMAAATPRLKTDYAGYAGIAHATAC